ncbi:MAG: putative ABC transporter permease [Treponema sp.]|jgi:uncharacterized membrane protein|nr:putative ABC transporter permease [Treponema sp.]
MTEFTFMFFFLSFSGWVLESAHESIVRGKPINKGFFKGPWIPVQGIGAFGVYFLLGPLRNQPVLVFLAGAVLCTAVEYATALFLEKCFKVKSWDYNTYPHTKWCHFQGRICLTISLFFGMMSLMVVYFYWSFTAALAASLGTWLLPVDGVLVGLFVVDVCYSCSRVIRLNRAGIKIKSWGAFSDVREIE